ncbi:hypothetical protein [Nonomuraea recticatena]
MSVGPGSARLAALASAPPHSVRRRIFTGMGAAQAIPLDRARQIRGEDLAQWVVDQYGPGPHPAVVIGSASGGAVHLAAALRAPFLPQTTLVGLRDATSHPDDPAGAMQALAPTARLIARNNPELAVYHMHDPAQDRPMIEAMAYIRLKRLTLGRVYERFLAERLAPGASVIVLDCARRWGSTEVGERAYFQFGCLGGLPEEEYFDSGDRVARYLAEQDSPWRRWEPPTPDARRPEAEWGFHPALLPDLEQVTERYGYCLRRLAVSEPQDLSRFTADLYRWWYYRRGLPATRLVVESYVQWDPHWILRLGAVPFWMRFNMEPDYEELARYLDEGEPYDKINLNLFSQGLWSPGVVPVERWQELIEKYAREEGEIVGVDIRAYPLDVGSSLRYQPAYAALPSRQPMPAPLAMRDIDRFLDETDRAYPLTWR